MDIDYNNLDLRNKTAFSLIDYAEYIDDKKLILAIETEFAKEFSEFFNE